SRGRERAHVVTAGSAINAIAETIRTPVCAMLPAPIAPLQHDLAWQVFGIQIHVSIKNVACPNRQRCRRICKKMLVRSWRDAASIGQRARKWSRIAADPRPGVTALGTCYRPSRNSIINPDDVR